MFFVVDRARLERMIALTRDDRTRPLQAESAPYFRMAAEGSVVRLTGRVVEAEFPATVYEPGVLFLKVTAFRRLLATFAGEKTIAIQANKDGLFFGNVHFSLDVGDMLLYASPANAPMVHPQERLKPDQRMVQGTLFDTPE